MADIWSEKDVGFITFLPDLTIGPTYFAKSVYIVKTSPFYGQANFQGQQLTVFG